MTTTVLPAASGFGAVVTGLDLSRPLPAATLAAVKAAFAAHAVLSFPGQPLDLGHRDPSAGLLVKQILAFSQHVGALGNKLSIILDV